MKLLLDTHAYIWWALGDSKRLSARAKKAIDRAASVFVSAASVYEMTCKHRSGDLPRVGALIMRLDEDLAARGFLPLPITDRKSTRLNSSHIQKSRMPSSA